MKIRITLKDPDALIDCIRDAVYQQPIEELSKSEIDEGIEARKQRIIDLCGRWFEYSEYLAVEVDTERETCTVLEL
jgi:hypothetical protein